MRIRDAQVEALRDVRETHFVEELVVHLHTHFPEEVKDLSGDSLRQELRKGLTRARGYGLASSELQTRFIGLAALFGWAFDQDEPWVAEALSDTTFEPDERMNRVETRFQRRLETSARNAKARMAFGIAA
ncbi:hypothetical protein [Myxococcus sp. NMCA1]|uniref:hypothetical protein n=1 Tax=Myxococcus sp. NMCA1 TaxID=2996785 RepID=UPI00228587CA|nr:hypothetical protein [Myxococcus sp. NMCA1]WAM29861.1 hypothetical protein OZ403_17720 [Myxococcus sp. NMCA1]